MKIACVYKSGGDFDARYVQALGACLHRHVDEEFEFICLTDRPKEVERFVHVIELQHDLPGWWSKIELFNPKVLEDDYVLYFDLDVIVLKSLYEMLKVVKKSFYPIMLRSRDAEGELNDWPSSSIMAWQGHNMDEVYQEFFRRGNVIETAGENISRAGQRTDQGFIRTVVNPDKFQDYLPKGYVIFKMDYLRNPSLYDQATVLNWTGKPRFHTMDNKYLKIKSLWDSGCLWNNQ